MNEGAWQSFSKGIGLLEAGRPRTAVLIQWEQTLKTYSTSRYTEQLKDLVEQLQMQVREDVELARTQVPEPTNLPPAGQIAYYTARLCDVHGAQWSQPGHCSTLGLGKETAFSDALVKIGRPAVPALIERLNDRRLTRSIGFWRNFAPDRTVLRYQDVAVQCIEAIVDIRFYVPSSTSAYLSNEKPEVREQVIADITRWWKEHGQESPLQGHLARLESGRTHERLRALEKIEKLDPKAVDSIATLKRWAKGCREAGPARQEELIYMARELGRRGDLTMLPEVRQIVRQNEHPPSEAVWYLLKWGDASDYGFMLGASRKELAAGRSLGSVCIWGAVLGGMASNDKPLAVPLLVEFLGQREMTGSRWVSALKRGMPFCAADTSIKHLIRLTGHDEGYEPDDPAEQRFAAMDRWLAWWNKEGQQSYVAKHLELKAMLP